MIKFFQLISIGAALSNLVLTVFLLSRDFRSAINRTYVLWGMSITLWNVGVFFMFRVTEPEVALFWARILHFGVIFLPVSLLHLAFLVAQIKIDRWIFLLYGLQLFFAFSNFTDLFISGVRYTGYAYYSIAGPAYWLFLPAYAASAGTTLCVLYRRQRSVSPLHRVRLHCLMVAAAILIVFGLNDIGPIFGIDTYPGTDANIYPLGSLAAIFYSLIVTYSVLQHQLLDIHVTLGKLAAHLVRLLFLCLVGFALLLVAALIVPDEFSIVAFFSALGVLLISGTAASVFFPRLFGQGDDALERRILGDRFEYHDKIQGFIQSVPWYSDTSLLLHDFDELLVNTVKLQSYHIILLDESSRKYSLFHSHPQPPAGQSAYFARDAAIFDLFRTAKLSYLPLNPAYAMPVEASVTQEARRELVPFNPEFCFPFTSEEGPFGLLLLGKKMSEEPYTATDLYMLDLLVKNLAIHINQIRLKHKVLQAEESELLGRMSRGMAHDLSNLLTPVSTFVQLCAAGRLPSQMPPGLLPIAVSNIGSIKEYIQEALFFSQNHTPQFRICRIDALARKVVESFEATLERKRIEAIIQSPADLSIEMDEVLIQRLISNLLSNALDASAPGSRVVVELAPLHLSGGNGDWLRLRVVDFGIGISRENLKRVLTPYFTTKIHGDANRGFGLGLAISHKIVRLHGGNLSIASEEKKGTTVQVDLPCQQTKEIGPATRLTA